MNARQLSTARKRLNMVTHADDCTVDRCLRRTQTLTLNTLVLVAADLCLALDTIEVTREQLHEMLRKSES
jgi:hypothetical protein